MSTTMIATVESQSRMILAMLISRFASGELTYEQLWVEIDREFPPNPSEAGPPS